MNNTKPDLTLIKANIAFFKGDHSETQRLLHEYTAQHGFHPGEDANAPMLLWLDAQTQPERDERIKRLNILLANARPDTPYSHIARQYLQDEDYYQEKIHSLQVASGLYRSPWVRISGIALIAAALLFTVFALFGTKPEAHTGTVPAAASSLPSPSPLPDRSRALVADSFTARYPSGVLQITALEENSERVLNAQTQGLQTPVPGAQFYALSLVFECRSGVCNQPPEARIALRLGDGTLIEPRPNIIIAGEDSMQAIALGRTTAGWVIFEIPLVSTVEALVVFPRDGSAFEPVSLALPGIQP